MPVSRDHGVLVIGCDHGRAAGVAVVLVFVVDFLEQVVQHLLVGVGVDFNFRLSWSQLLFFLAS